MQAVRVRPESRPRSRWITHALVVAAFVFLAREAFPSAARVEPATPGRRLLDLRMPASPVLDWRPVRTTVRPRALGEPSPSATVGLPRVEAPAVDEVAGAVAWVPAVDVGVSGPPSTPVASIAGLPPTPFTSMTSVRDVTLRSGPEPDADVVARAPRLTLLETLGPEVEGRIPVRLGIDDQAPQIRAWVDAAAMAAAKPSTLPRPWDRPFAFGESWLRLNVPYRTQLDGSVAAEANCGPASLGMILDSVGTPIPTSELRDQAHRFQGTSGPNTGFLLEVLQRVAELHGLEAQGLMDGRRYHRWTLDELRQHLRAGHPVIPQLRYRLMPGREWAAVNYDHYLVLTGLDGDDFLFNDPIPWAGQGQGRITGPQLLRAWANSDAPMAALAIAAPR